MEEHIEVEGRITTVLAGTMFRVELDNKHQVLATISGKMRKRFVRLTAGDRVKMEMSPYDLNKAGSSGELVDFLVEGCRLKVEGFAMRLPLQLSICNFCFLT